MDSNMLSDAKLVLMQESHDLFMGSLLLVLDILSKAQYANATKLAGALGENQLDINKKTAIISKTFSILTSKFSLLKDSSSELFNLFGKSSENKTVKITVIPAIDIGSVWAKLDKTECDNIWAYLKCIFVGGMGLLAASDSGSVGSVKLEDLVQIARSYKPEYSLEFDEGNARSVIGSLEKVLSYNNKMSNQVYDEFFKSHPDSQLISKREFNPFVGVGSNTDSYGLDDLLKNVDLPSEPAARSSIGVSQVIKLIGVDKMIDMNELSNQLKNMPKEKIDQAIGGIKELLGDADPETSNMIDMMLQDITKELDKDTGDVDPITKLTSIAENVAQNLLPKIDPKKLDMKKVWDTTKKMASGCKDANGKSMFGGPNNPLDMLTGFMERQMGLGGQKSQGAPEQSNSGSTQSNSGSTQSNSGSTQSNSGSAQSKEQIMKECQDMLKSMGMGNVSPDQLKNLPMGDLDKLLGVQPKAKSKGSKAKVSN